MDDRSGSASQESRPHDRPAVLWIDLRVNSDDRQLEQDLSDICIVSREPRLASVAAAIKRVRPKALCFDYDYPTIEALQALPQTKRDFPSLPLLMLTEQHSEALAVWAFRAGARDYLVKPLAPGELQRAAQGILQLLQYGGQGGQRTNLMRWSPLPMDARLAHGSTLKQRTLPALPYIEAHLHEKISLSTIARLCHMGTFEFSRTFRHEHGQTFREYLLRCRLERARTLLVNSRIHITDIALLVGFNDLSHFIRAFRRHTGFTPSAYRLMPLPTLPGTPLPLS